MFIVQAHVVSAQNVEQYWDVNGTDSGLGGTGVWDVTLRNWGDATGTGEPAEWLNLAESAAIFDGSPGTVTLGALNLAANLLHFRADGYQLEGTVGSSLIFFAPQPRIKVDEGLASIAAEAVGGVDGLTVEGPGGLWLKAGLSLSGGVTVTGGVLRLGTTDAGISDPRLFLSGNTLRLSNGGLEIYANSSANSNVGTGRITVEGESFITTFRTDTGAAATIGTSLGALGVTMNGQLTWDVAGNTLTANTTTTNLGLTLGPVTLAGPSTFVTTGDGVRNTYMYIGAVQEVGGPQSLIKAGGGSLRFNGTNTNEGPTIIKEGDIYLTATANLSPNSAVVISPEAGKTARLNLSTNGPHLESIASLSSEGEGTAAVTLGSSSLTVGRNGTDTSFTGVISGTGGKLTKVGAGTLTLNSANTFSGGLFLEEGTLRVTNISALGSTASPASPRVFLRAGTLRVDLPASISSNTNRGFQIGPEGGEGSVTLSIDSANQLTITGVVEDAPGGRGRIIKTGPGTVRFQDVASTYTGGMTILEGTVSVAIDSRLGAAPTVATPGHLVINGGALLATANFTLNANRGVALGPDAGAGAGTISVSDAATLTYAGVIADNSGGSGRLIKRGAGTLRLQNVPNTFTGGVEILEGDISIGLDSRIGAVPPVPVSNSLHLNGGALTTTSGFTLSPNRGILVGPETGSGFGVINVTTGTLTYAGVISDHADGLGALVKAGEGTLALTGGVSTFKGGLEILAGTVVAEQGPASLGMAGVVFRGSGVLRLSNWAAAPGAGQGIAIASGVTGTVETTTNNPFFTVRGEVTGDGALAKTGAGLLRLAGVNSYVGGTQVLAGTLEVLKSAGSGTGVGPVSVAGGATLAGVGSVAGPVLLGGLQGQTAVLRPGFEAAPLGRPTLELGSSLSLGEDARVVFRLSEFGNTKLTVDEITLIDPTARMSVQLASAFVPAPGTVYDLLDVATLPMGANLEAALELPAGIDWDTSEFAVTGRIRVVGIALPLQVTAPASQIVAPGSSVTLSVSASGTGPYLIRWFKDGDLLPDVEGPEYFIANATAADGGSYRAEVTNGVETVLSEPGILLVSLVPVITAEPQPQTVTSGQPAQFSVTAAGPGTLGYDWRRNGISLGAPNSPFFSLSAATLSNAGDYSVRVFNENGAVFSQIVPLVVNEPPKITVPPQRRSAADGVTVTFEVTATGTGPLRYQWQFDEEDITGETGPSLQRVAGPTTYGSYRVVVSNDFGSDTSAAALLSPPRAGDPQRAPEWDFAGTLPPAQAGVAYAFTPGIKPDDPTFGVFRGADTFTARGLPPGLVMNPATGEISGVPTAFRATPYAVILTAVNGLGATSLATRITVSGLPAGFTGVYGGTIERGALLSLTPGDVNGPLGGRLDLTVTDNGSLSGKVTVGVGVLSFRGRVVVDGVDPSMAALQIEIVQRGVRILTVQGRLNSATGELENGAVSDGTNTSLCKAWRNPWSRTNRADALAGYHTCRFDLSDTTLASAQAPVGSGFASFTVNPTTGKLTVAGRLADGTAVTIASFAGPQGQVPLFRTLYAAAARGSVLGSIQIQPVMSGGTLAGGAMSWLRPANAARGNRLYRPGFPSVLEVEIAGGSYKVPTPASPRVLGLTETGNVIELNFEGGDLATALPATPAVVATVDTRNRAVFDPSPQVNTRKVVLTITPRTGAFKGRFVLSEPNPLLLPGVVKNVVRTVAYQGLIVGNEGAGYFILPLLPQAAGETPTNTPQEGGGVTVKPVP